MDPRQRIAPLTQPSPRGERENGDAGRGEFFDKPFVTALTLGNRRLVAAASPAATAAGIAPGMPLADAQAFLPGLAIHEADLAGDAAALRRLAEWCTRWSPWTAPDGADGILLDVTGCAHLAQGERRLAEAAVERLARLGFAARAAIADGIGAAWALARFGAAPLAVVPPGAARAALAPLPVAALRLAPDSAAGLERLGLKRIGDLYAMPRAALAQRFGAALADRLDAALGAVAEPLSPLGAAPARRVRLAFAEPIATAEDLARASAHLAAELCRSLAAEGAGARRLVLSYYRVDGRVERLALGTAAPSRDPRHLARLLAEKLPAIDPGLGIEDMVLAAPVAEPLAPAQLALTRLGSQSPPPRPSPVEGEGDSWSPPPPLRGRVGVGGIGSTEQRELGTTPALATLIDRLGIRLGLANLHRPAVQESHIPERAVALLPPLAAPAAASWPRGAARPIRLLAPPQPIEAMAPVPDDPPILFRWRRVTHRVRRADGPERIAGEWWRAPSAAAPGDIRDYYRVEDEAGCRFWLFRAGLYRADRPARWFLHGLFA